jgi:hypothetical protein
MTHQALRRTFATHFQHHGSVKDTQSQLRHADPETTLRYYQKRKYPIAFGQQWNPLRKKLRGPFSEVEAALSVIGRIHLTDMSPPMGLISLTLALARSLTNR